MGMACHGLSFTMSCLLIVVRLTQGLPVTLVIEQGLVSTMRTLVVHNRGCGDAVFLLTHHAEGMLLQIALSSPLPGTAVPSLRCAATLTLMSQAVYTLMRGAEPMLHQRTASALQTRP